MGFLEPRFFHPLWRDELDLSWTFRPPWRFSPSSPAFQYVLRRPKATLKSTSLERITLRHSSDANALFFALSSSGRPEDFASPLQQWPPRGLATPLRLSAIRVPESLFQLPTPMGFPLQSFTPCNRSKRGFPFFFPFRRFPKRPYRPSTDAPTVWSRFQSRPPQCGWKD